MKCERPIELFTWSDWPWLQTDPCGVEARRGAFASELGSVTDGPLWGRSVSHPSTKTPIESYRRTLVGSKLAPDFGSDIEFPVTDGPLWGRSDIRLLVSFRFVVGYRRTLVGSKPEPLALALAVAHGLQTDPCGVEAPRGTRPGEPPRVTDGPLWGRSCTSSTRLSRPTAVTDGPLWGRSSRASRAVWPPSPVTDGPLWGRSWPSAPVPEAFVELQTDPCGVEALIGPPGYL